MKKIIYMLTTILITFFSNNSLIASEKKDEYSCKPKHAAAIRSNGIQTFEIKGDEKPLPYSKTVSHEKKIEKKHIKSTIKKINKVILFYDDETFETFTN